MIKNYKYLNDSSFLQIIDKLKIREFILNISILDWEENFVSSIEGRVLPGGTITVDGKSSIRRTVSLTVLADGIINNIQNTDNLLSINKKIYLQIGFKNITQYYQQYPIIYFPLGYYVVTSLSISRSRDGVKISLQAKDKMCLLNGQCGGIFPASVVLDNYDTTDENGQIVNSRPTIYQIIKQLVNHFGKQQLSKIIISDLDTRVKQVLRWYGETPLYFLQKLGGYFLTTNVKEYEAKLDNGFYNILGSPFEYGYDVGYTYTDFTYPGELIAQAGSTVTQILDTIKTVLGNYEYFYDIEGNFVFQQIKNYLNNSQTKYVIDAQKNEIPMADYLSDLRTTGNIVPSDYLLNNSLGKSVYKFNDSTLIDSYTNNPQYGMIKNDYVVWGSKKTNNNSNIIIRYHLAIDKKPETGKEHIIFPYKDPDDGLIKYHVPIQFLNRQSFPKKGVQGVFYLALYQDIIYEWKEINDVFQYSPIQTQAITAITNDWRTQLYLQGIQAQPFGTQSNYYFSELQNEWPKLFEFVKVGNYYYDRLKEQVRNAPEKIDYYLDFIDSSTSISNFEVDNIGRRTQVINQENAINCIFEPYTPDFIILPTAKTSQDGTAMNQLRKEADARNQSWVQVSDNIYNCLKVGGTFNSAYQEIRQMLHQYTSYNESISLTCLPIYHLEPNTRITVNDPESNIYGDYMIDSMSYTFDVGANMSIACSRALEKI